MNVHLKWYWVLKQAFRISNLTIFSLVTWIQTASVFDLFYLTFPYLLYLSQLLFPACLVNTRRSSNECYFFLCVFQFFITSSGSLSQCASAFLLWKMLSPHLHTLFDVTIYFVTKWHLLLILPHEPFAEPFLPPAIKACVLVTAFCFFWTRQGRNIIR